MSKSSNSKEKKEVKKHNFQILDDYMAWRSEHGADAQPTRIADESNIRQFIEWLVDKRSKRLNDLTESDILAYATYLKDFKFTPAKGKEEKSYSDGTKFQKKKCLKVFLQYLYLKKHITVDLSEEIKLKKAKTERVIEKPLDWDDVDRLLEACNHPRDRAMIHFLMDSGVRRGELLGIRYGHVTFLDGAVQVLVPPIKKNKEHRRVYCVRSAKDMRIWAEHHPLKAKDSYFFCSSHLPHGKFSIQGQCDQLHAIAKRAGFEDGIYNHLFRHSSASLYCQMDGMNVYKINKRYGWKLSSTMADTYMHLSGQESDDDIKRAFGQPVQKKVDSKNVIICPVCHLASPDNADWCDNCGKALSTAEIAKEEAAEAEKEKRKIAELKKEIISEMREESERRQKELEERLTQQFQTQSHYKADELKKGRRIIDPSYYNKK